MQMVDGYALGKTDEGNVHVVFGWDPVEETENGKVFTNRTFSEVLLLTPEMARALAGALLRKID